MRLNKLYPEYDWEIKNQVFMHIHNPDTNSYKNSKDAIVKFPETCTAIAVRLLNDELELFCPFGISDIVNFVVNPTPYFQNNAKRMIAYRQKIASKNWFEKWPDLKIVEGGTNK